MNPNDFELDYPRAVVGEIRLGLINPEDALVIATNVALFKQFGSSPTMGLVASMVSVYAFRKATAGQAPGYLQYKLSCISPSAAEIPVIGQIVALVSKMIRKSWLQVGSIPPHTQVQRYER